MFVLSQVLLPHRVCQLKSVILCSSVGVHHENQEWTALRDCEVFEFWMSLK